MNLSVEWQEWGDPSPGHQSVFLTPKEKLALIRENNRIKAQKGKHKRKETSAEMRDFIVGLLND